MQIKKIRCVFVLLLLLSANSVMSQLTAPGRNWAGLTEYINGDTQDSIFVFYGSTGNLKAQHTTGNEATFKWYHYNANVSNPANRFELIQTESGVLTSEQTDLAEGGYRVVVTDISNSTETYTAWVFTDNIVLSRIDVDSECDFLELIAVTQPNSYDVENDRFVYYDLSRTQTQPEMNKYGRNYFSSSAWSASDSRVEVDATSTLKLVVEDPAPLYNSSYTIEITNPFGRNLSAQTETITAIATKASMNIQVNEDGTWNDFDSNTDYEALLELRLESTSINADSIYWKLLNLKVTNLANEYVTIWADSSLFSQGLQVAPDKKYMKPGYFKIKHLAYNTTSGCKDSLEQEVVVDSSFIKSDAIPNVFSPNNGDDVNNVFKFVDPDQNIKSIKRFTIKIYSRSGKLIYTHSGNPRDWEGWNGKIDGTGADAAEGIYYFIIEAVGWDGREFDYGPYKGFVYLFRGR